MQWLATRLVSGRLVPSVLFMLFLVLFFGLTAPANLTEPGDELTFARATEECGIDVLTDPRLLGYHLLARASYALVAVAGFDVSGGYVSGSDKMWFWTHGSPCTLVVTKTSSR